MRNCRNKTLYGRLHCTEIYTFFFIRIFLNGKGVASLESQWNIFRCFLYLTSSKSKNKVKQRGKYCIDSAEDSLSAVPLLNIQSLYLIVMLELCTLNLFSNFFVLVIHILYTLTTIYRTIPWGVRSK